MNIETPNKPMRIHCSRQVKWKADKNMVYVGRPSAWGNIFRVADILEAYQGDVKAASADCVRSYRQWLLTDPQGQKVLAAAKAKLRGKNLACWCPPSYPCHADVLLELVNEGT